MKEAATTFLMQIPDCRKWRAQQRALKREQRHAKFQPNGKREVARRARQIERGQLRVSA